MRSYLDLHDIERVEVLKGPQGTLFGRNTIGGPINVVTRRPGDRFSWRGEFTTGEFDRFDIAGSADLPLGAGLSALVAFSSKQRDGYLERIPFHATAPFVTDNNRFLNAGYQTSEREGGQDEQTLRIELLWTPSDTLELTVAADYTQVDQPASPVTVVETHEADPDRLAFMYNLCVNTPAAVLNNVIVHAAGYAPFNTTSGRLLRARHCRHGARGCERRRESGQRSPVVRLALPAAGHRPQLQYAHQLLRAQGARCRCDRRLAAHRRDAPEVDLGLSRARLVERRRRRRRADRMCG